MVWVPILDHCIPVDTSNYEPYSLGMEMDIFIKGTDGKVLFLVFCSSYLGEPLYADLWAGYCYIPDFTHPNSTTYWSTLIEEFYEAAEFSGIWIDMDEPSNICVRVCKFLLSPLTEWLV